MLLLLIYKYPETLLEIHICQLHSSEITSAIANRMSYYKIKIKTGNKKVF